MNVSSTSARRGTSQTVDELAQIERLKSEIRIRCGSLITLAKQHGYRSNAISFALRNSWPAVERIIADCLGREPWEIWPDRYTTDRRPQPLRPARGGARRGEPRSRRAKTSKRRGA